MNKNEKTVQLIIQELKETLRNVYSVFETEATGNLLSKTKGEFIGKLKVWCRILTAEAQKALELETIERTFAPTVLLKRNAC
ncbi:MAG: hypothetical protein HYT94_05615 [Parcubacteria group bacterium]|nr:hypothetical protein [Parcubacteria group bacterium]